MLLWPAICPACLTRAESTPGLKKKKKNEKKYGGEEKNITVSGRQKVRTNKRGQDCGIMMRQGAVGERSGTFYMGKERIKQ